MRPRATYGNSFSSRSRIAVRMRQKPITGMTGRLAASPIAMSSTIAKAT
jgi:hypothetical protein